MQDILYWSGIIIAGLLILTILLQQKSAGLGGAIAGGGGEHFSAGSGVDRLLSWITVILVIAFFGNAIAYLFV